VIAGSGLSRLFAGDGPLKKLRLVEAKPSGSGTLMVTYEPRRD
jgi:hypothetical protein